jgi:hypothetical protein
VVTTLKDVDVIIMGIIVLAILFEPYVARSISITNKTFERLTRKLKVSCDILRRNIKGSNRRKSDHSLIPIAFIPVCEIISIFTFMNLLGIHTLTFSLLRISLLLHTEMIIAL